MSYQDLVKQHGSIAKAADAIGIPKSTFGDRLHKERNGGEPTPGKAVSCTALTEEELLLKHSAEHQIRAAAQKLEKGTFYAEADFIRRVGVSGGYKHIVERQEFDQYRGKASGGVVYWGHPERIAALKAEGVLRG